MYLPPYSLDLNPIEQAFSLEGQGLLRQAEARTREGLIEAMGRALAPVTAQGYPRVASGTAATVMMGQPRRNALVLASQNFKKAKFRQSALSEVRMHDPA